MNAQVTIEEITPEVAQQFLDARLEEQRHLRDTAVLRLIEEMKSGRFRLTCDALVLIKGKLANGQHRLSALVQSGKTLPFIVMRTDDDELYKVIDCGITRTAIDVLGSMKNATNLPAATRLIIAYDRKQITASSIRHSRSHNPLTRSQVLEYIYQNNLTLSEDIDVVLKMYQDTHIIPVSIAVAFLNIASRTDRPAALKFLENVYRGTKEDAALDFRERMIRNMSSRARIQSAYVFGLLIKAYRSYRNNTRPSNLKMVDGEDFPEI